MFISRSAAETESAGARVAKSLRAGDVLALAGELGAGKTQFVKGIARGLHCSQPVTSPTFTIVHHYQDGDFSIYHFDFYRLENRRALEQISFDEYLQNDGICVIEWADKMRNAIPPDARWINFKIISVDERAIDLSAFE